MTHHRLFVALVIPAETRAALVAAMGGIAGARWQDEDQLHCTVRFLGEFDARVANDVAAALGGLVHPAIEATLDGLGAFDRAGRIESLWVSVYPLTLLRALHAKVDRLLLRGGIAPDDRAYRPHVTIARFTRSVAPPAGIVGGLAPPPRLSCRLDEIRLYESLLGRDGARYEVVERFPLR